MKNTVDRARVSKSLHDIVRCLQERHLEPVVIDPALVPAKFVGVCAVVGITEFAGVSHYYVELLLNGDPDTWIEFAEQIRLVFDSKDVETLPEWQSLKAFSPFTKKGKSLSLATRAYHASAAFTPDDHHHD